MGVRTRALVTDMSQPLAPCAGNAVEIVETLALLRGERRRIQARDLCGRAGGGRQNAHDANQVKRSFHDTLPLVSRFIHYE